MILWVQLLPLLLHLFSLQSMEFKHLPPKPHFHCFYFLLYWLSYCPCLTSIHQNRFYITLKDSLSCGHWHIFVRLYGFHFLKYNFCLCNSCIYFWVLLPSCVMSVPRYLKDCFCFSFVPSTKMLHSGVVFLLITITSVFLLFRSKPFFCFHFSPHLAGSVGLFDFLLLVPCRLHILDYWLSFHLFWVLAYLPAILILFCCIGWKGPVKTHPCVYIMENKLAYSKAEDVSSVSILIKLW